MAGYCQNCGTVVGGPTERFCSHCGSPIGTTQLAPALLSPAGAAAHGRRQTLRELIVQYEVNSSSLFPDDIPTDQLDVPATESTWTLFLEFARIPVKRKPTVHERRMHWSNIRPEALPESAAPLAAEPAQPSAHDYRGTLEAHLTGADLYETIPEEGGLVSATGAMIAGLIVLFWLPLLGQLIAGFFGGWIAGSLPKAARAVAVTTALAALLAPALASVAQSFDLLGGLILIAVAAIPLLAGALLAAAIKTRPARSPHP